MRKNCSSDREKLLKFEAGEWRLCWFVFVVITLQIGLKIHRIFQTSKDSDKTNPITETNNTSYESPNTQLFGARRMRAWHHHPPPIKLFSTFLFEVVEAKRVDFLKKKFD